MATTTKKQPALKVAETPEVKATPQGIRPEALAKELGIDAKKLRAFLRTAFTRPETEKRSSWYLTEKQVEAVRDRFTPSDDETEVSE